MPFINKPDSSRDLSIFMIQFFVREANSKERPNPKIFLWIAASVANAAAVNPNGMKMLLANGLSTFPIKDNSAFSNGPKWLPKNLPDCPILCN